MSSAELGRWAFVTPQAMNLVVSALEKRGLVRRRSDPQHRRVLRTMVTPKGFDVLEHCDRSMDVIEADMLGDMPAASVEELREMLAACAHALEATRPRPPIQFGTPQESGAAGKPALVSSQAPWRRTVR
jgi:DNA-binding MarR family transcriptional regulator